MCGIDSMSENFMLDNFDLIQFNFLIWIINILIYLFIYIDR